MDKVLIFGAGGFVGPYLVKEFVDHGYEVYGSDKSGVMLPKGCTGTYFGDLLDKEAIKSIIYKVQPTHVVNLAAISSVGLSWKIPQQTMEINVCGALNILDAIRENDIDPKILLIGSSEEYMPSDKPMDENTPINANNPYGISKVTLEQFSTIYHEKYGMKIYHVRSFNHTGVGQGDNFVIPSWCKQVAEISLSGKPGVIKTGNLDIQRDFSDVRDVVRAYRMIIESNDSTDVYNVGSGVCVHLTELIQGIIGLSEQPIRLEQDPKLVRPIENSIICCNHSKITSELGWKPEHDIFDTIKDMYAYYLKH